MCDILVSERIARGRGGASRRAPVECYILRFRAAGRGRPGRRFPTYHHTGCTDPNAARRQNIHQVKKRNQ